MFHFVDDDFMLIAIENGDLVKEHKGRKELYKKREQERKRKKKKGFDEASTLLQILNNSLFTDNAIGQFYGSPKHKLVSKGLDLVIDEKERFTGKVNQKINNLQKSQNSATKFLGYSLELAKDMFF